MTAVSTPTASTAGEVDAARGRPQDAARAGSRRRIRTLLFLTSTAGGVGQHGLYLAEHLPRDETATGQQRRADGLVALARDWLSGDAPDHRRTGPVVTVTVDAAIAAETQGEAGVAITAGPRIGPETLDRVLCEGSVEVIVDSDSGVPLAVGPTSRVIPPKLRRWIIARDQRCVIDGCDSGYRLEVHHIVPRSQGGTHHPDNLTTLCWWHHHHAIHGQGRRFDSTSPPRRRRLLPPVDP